MKIAKQQLLKLIKEELETVMKEVEELEEVKSDREQQGAVDKLAHDKAKKGMMKQDLADKEKEAKGQDKNPVASEKRPLGGKPNLNGKDGKYNNPVKSAYGTAKGQGLVAEAELDEAEELEEIKGAMGRNLAKFGREMARPTGGDPSNSVRSAIRNVDLSADKRDEPDDDYYADDDQLGSATKDEEIDGMLSVMGVDPQSQEGMDLRVAIKAAAEKVRARSTKRYGQVAQGGLNEEGKEMKQISESFRRFTKILKG